jgi:predicted DCC family thiol-disulfide oxidoreductase YuxK
MSRKSLSGNSQALEVSTVIYDSDCVLCSRSANFIAARDHLDRFWYSEASSGPARELLARHGIDAAALDAVVLIEGGRAYTGSTAAFRVLATLPYPWRALSLLRLVPNLLREPLYRFVARNRHRVFSGASCPAPHPKLQERLLTDRRAGAVPSDP